MLEITIWDVNHGSAAYIKTPNNRHGVVDLGDAEGFSPLQTLRNRGLTYLDFGIITHPHRDHLDDIFNFALLPARTVNTPWHLSEAAIRKGNRATDSAHVDRYLQLRSGCTFPVIPTDDIAAPTNYGGVEFQVFGSTLCEDSNLNNHSLVVIVSYAGLKIVLPGDNEAPSWKELLNQNAFVTAIKGADVLLASHHGRDAGYCGELFEAMGKPRLVVVSDGRFGDTSATDRYSKQASGWTVFDSSGSSETRYCVTTRCDGHITIKCGFSDDPRYRNLLNVTTSKTDLNSRFARHLGFQIPSGRTR
jgi:beta-lactamase superfamily II metal-dependent hydrolase